MFLFFKILIYLLENASTKKTKNGILMSKFMTMMFKNTRGKGLFSRRTQKFSSEQTQFIMEQGLETRELDKRVNKREEAREEIQWRKGCVWDLLSGKNKSRFTLQLILPIYFK